MSNEVRTTFQILPENLDLLQEKLAKLNKKASKLGCEPIVCTVLGEVMVQIKSNDEDEKPRLEKRIEVSVIGKAPKLNGWSIAAVIEHSEVGNILRAVPPFSAEAFNAQFRTSSAICEHCGFDRKRKDTYIVKHDDGRQAQVGRTCLKDFTGHASPEGIATWAEIISCLEELVNGFGGGSSSVQYFNLSDILETAACVIRRDGFMSRIRAQKIAAEKNFEWMPTTTAETVNWLFAPIRCTGKEAREEAERKAAYKIQDTDKETAAAAHTWTLNLDPTVDQDYLWNLRVVANMGEITYRNMGLAVSMIAAWKREMDRLAGIEYERKTRPASEFVGTIGEKLTITVTLKKAMEFETRFGMSTLHIFTDANGNTLTWWTKNSGMEETHTYEIKGTVKAHEIYSRTKDEDGFPVNGTKQTVLTRCKIVREIEATVDESVTNIFATT